MFKNRWWAVVGSVLALIVGQGAINVFAASVFIKPVAQQFGFGRGVISSAMALANILTALSIPWFGRMLDRYGIRPVLLPAIVLYALATASLSLMNGSVFVLLALFAFQGIVGAGQTATPYSKVVSARFDSDRGLALGITLAGVGLGTILVPQASRILLREFGWQAGYIGLGIGIIVLAFIPVAILFRDVEGIKAKDKGGLQAALPGMTFSEAARTTKFWTMTAAFFLGNMAIAGALIHLVPMLTDRGIPISTATALLSASGLAIIVGRIAFGYIMDYVFAPYVAIFMMFCPMVGLAILGLNFGGAGPLVGTVLLGLSMGAESDVLAYLIGRYFGIKAFGAIHGFMFAGLLIANALGQTFLGWCFQLRRSYNAGFLVFEVALVITIILFAVLGPYRYPALKPSKAKAANAS